MPEYSSDFQGPGVVMADQSLARRALVNHLQLSLPSVGFPAMSKSVVSPAGLCGRILDGIEYISDLRV